MISKRFMLMRHWVGTVLAVIVLSSCVGAEVVNGFGESSTQVEPLPSATPSPLGTTTLQPDAPTLEAVADIEAYWLQFETFELIQFGRSSNTPLKLTETRFSVPHQGTGVVVTVHGGGSGDLHISPAGPHGDGLAAFFNHVGARWAPRQVQLVLNVLDNDAPLSETVVVNTTWEDWSATITPVGELPFIREAGELGLSGGQGGFVFRADGLATQIQVDAEAPFSADAYTASGEKIPVYGSAAGEVEPGHILVPPEAAWIEVVFESEWALSPLVLNAVLLEEDEVQGRTLVDGRNLDPLLLPPGLDGYVIDDGGGISGPHPAGELPIDAHSLWVYLVPQRT